MIDPGFSIQADTGNLEYRFGDDVFGSSSEKRRLDDIRTSLSNPDVSGPEYVYSVVMDTGKKKDLEDLKNRNLLYGAMIFSDGMVGNEPVRSQGHVHAVSKSCDASTCEVYEIWSGKACIYMQETDSDDPGRCFAVFAEEGEVVIVPPGWAHCTINADPQQPMLFGAWCVRDYGFDYTGIRKHHGVAWFPKMKDGDLVFLANPAYCPSELVIKKARSYPEFNLKAGVPIYTQYESDPDLFAFVTDPKQVQDLWDHYEP